MPIEHLLNVQRPSSQAPGTTFLEGPRSAANAVVSPRGHILSFPPERGCILALGVSFIRIGVGGGELGSEGTVGP